MTIPDKTLSPEQMTLLLDNHDLIDAFLALTDSADFKTVFREMSLDELVSRYEATLHFDDVESDTVLRERYSRMKSEMSSSQPEMLEKLRGPSLFDEDE